MIGPTIPRLIASVLGVGYQRPAPGTWGSALALPWAWLLHEMGGFGALVVATAVAFFLGWWATAQMLTPQDKDPSWIVIDELAGMWLALWPLSFAASAREIDVLAMWPGWISAFVLFRLFDIWKPWLVGMADRRGDALGVMLDDMVAGLFAALGTLALAAFAHGVLM
ncbi:MAG: phosphatidylglycerophosphatase A [Pseudomonadota bacterium]